MAIQWMSDKRVAQIKKDTGLPVLAVSVRGGQDHSKTLYLPHGVVAELRKDGGIALLRPRVEE